MQLRGQALVRGTARGELLFSDTPLSFWGGTNTSTGTVIDSHHPLCGRELRGRILAIPCGRGSCSGSMAILELLLNDCAPCALIFSSVEEILAAGVIIAKILFSKTVPVVLLSGDQFSMLESQSRVTVVRNTVLTGDTHHGEEDLDAEVRNDWDIADSVQLSAKDQHLLHAGHGQAAAVAMQILVEFAKMQGAKRFIDVAQSHLDAVHYTGPASLKFAEHVYGTGDASFAIPTSMNAISLDQRRWRELGVDHETAEKANRLANIFVSMGAKPTFTCAPYLLGTAPESGQDVAWGESNAVVFTNSVLGAFTQKYPDMIEVCIALTGRAPMSGCHLESGRLPNFAIAIRPPSQVDDSFWPVAGYCTGERSGNRIPLVTGLEECKPSHANLKAFSAAFATTSSAPMFHIRGVTPGHCILRSTMRKCEVHPKDLLESWRALTTAQDPTVSVVALGNPHFSFEEFEMLCSLIKDEGDRKHSNVQLMITTSRDTLDRVSETALLPTLQSFGADIVTDTCWCFLQAPVVHISDPNANIMTNSAKYAHYAPGIVSRKIHFGNLADCVAASRTGLRRPHHPVWYD